MVPTHSHGPITVRIIKLQACGTWALIVQSDSQLLNYFTTARLIEALELACTLQLHVDNTDELPLNQYYKVA